MTEKVLLVDDDQNILAGYRRQLHKMFELVTASSGHEGLDIIQSQGPFAVIISDMRMPEMDGVRFLTFAQALAPHTVRMMLTGNNDLQTAVDAVNQGNIFRFMNKPCPPEQMAACIQAGLEQYRLVMAEKELLEKTLKGSIKVLTDILSLVSPVAFGRASRVQRLASQIASVMHTNAVWQIELAAMLSQLGCLTIPGEVMQKAAQGKILQADQAHMYEAHPLIGCDLLRNIPRLEAIAQIILYQEKHFDGSGAPKDDCRENQIPIGSRILKVALDYDALQNAGFPSPECLLQMGGRQGWYDPAVLDALKQATQASIPYEMRLVNASEIYPGMILAHDLTTTGGTLLLAKGQEITQSLCMCMKNLGERGTHISEPIQVLVPMHLARPTAAIRIPNSSVNA